ncbi:hypothetical protein [Hyphomonas sp.]|uniref:hypothetical protein n=1 Tax=Hyphomonas sp. TaxID=87 RepID=UPI003F6EF182|tara:strand:+ start:12537 stop:14513 length:1977 start_codon:yes stop_codon:yes gene_type:complete
MTGPAEKTLPVNIAWDRIAVPGVTPGAHYFRLPAGRPGPVRLAFVHEAGLKFDADQLFCFSMRSPSSTAMYPDILRGDHGYPTISLTNAKGVVFSFARGNIKDFFNISTPNKRQDLRLPLAAFVFDIYLKDNPKPDGDFFDEPIIKITFDFLSHPDTDIDMEIGNLHGQQGPVRPRLDFETNLVLSKRPEHGDVPMMATENGLMALRVAIADPKADSMLRKRPLYWAVYEGDSAVVTGHVFLAKKPVDLDIRVPRVGVFELRMRVEMDNQVVASTKRSIVRMMPKPAPFKRHVMGFSDGSQYSLTWKGGGSFDRTPINLRTVQSSIVGGVPPGLPPKGQGRYFAFLGIPVWLSSRPERTDFGRYAPKDMEAYAKLLTDISEQLFRKGATHIEVWNEAGSISEWADEMDKLVEVHRVAYATLKAISPQVHILGGGTHTWDFDFLRRFLEAGGGHWCDGISLHGYTYDPIRFLEHFDALDALLAEYIPADRLQDFKAHITEIGFRTPTFSQLAQARWLSLYTLEAASRARVGSILWFRLYNSISESLQSYQQRASAGYAMIGNSEGNCRHSLFAFRLLDNLLTMADRVVAEGNAATRIYRVMRGQDQIALATFNGGFLAGRVMPEASIPEADKIAQPSMTISISDPALTSAWSLFGDVTF